MGNRVPGGHQRPATNTHDSTTPAETPPPPPPPTSHRLPHHVAAVVHRVLQRLLVVLRQPANAVATLTAIVVVTAYIRAHRRRVAAAAAAAAGALGPEVSVPEFIDVVTAGAPAGACSVQVSPGDGVEWWHAVTAGGATVTARLALLPTMVQVLAPALRQVLADHRVPVQAALPPPPGRSSALVPLLLLLSPVAYAAVLWYLMQRSQNPPDTAVGRRLTVGPDATTFRDVAGMDSAKAEVAECVTALQHPARFTRVGARLPRGVLLHGPSGTGKTLLATAVAGEAAVPFLYCSASEFVEVLVGRGAARVRALFERARAQAPCVVFIDELDALGKARGGVHSHDEREQTLNQLLTAMDGTDAVTATPHGGRPPVLVVGATNRLSVLDSALLRPGRFDRIVEVPAPDAAGRAAILAVHLRRVPVVAPDVDVAAVAAVTPGFTGAELRNVVNEAALRTVRMGGDAVTASNLTWAAGKVAAAKAAAHAPSPPSSPAPGRVPHLWLPRS